MQASSAEWQPCRFWVCRNEAEGHPADGTASAYPKPRTPDHLVTAAVMPQTHAAYAATWYALSAAGAVMTCYV